MYNPTKPYTEQILSTIRKTWVSRYCEVDEGVYPVVIRKPPYDRMAEVDHTDGVGTKGYYLWKNRDWTTLAHDAMAMNLNDLAMSRAIPYKIQNHLVLPEEHNAAIVTIMEHLERMCFEREIAITGGETSIQNNLNGMDMSITMSGLIEPIILVNPNANKCKIGDVLIGIQSNGIHSNGWTKVRELFGDEFQSFLVKPTRIYFSDVQNLRRVAKINAMMHITGGAFTKLRKIISKEQNAIIHKKHNLLPNAIFRTIQKKGVSDQEMYTTFNCGIGFILSVPPESVQEALKIQGSDIIGSVEAGAGKIMIQSFFNNEDLVL